MVHVCLYTLVLRFLHSGFPTFARSLSLLLSLIRKAVEISTGMKEFNRAESPWGARAGCVPV